MTRNVALGFPLSFLAEVSGLGSYCFLGTDSSRVAQPGSLGANGTKANWSLLADLPISFGLTRSSGWLNKHPFLQGKCLSNISVETKYGIPFVKLSV